MCEHALLANPDILWEVVQYLPSVLALTATCTDLRDVLGGLCQFSINPKHSRRYVQDWAFRALINKRITNRSKQLKLNFKAGRCFGDSRNYGTWKPQYADVLAGVKDVELTVSWPVADLVPWEKLGEVVTQLSFFVPDDEDNRLRDLEFTAYLVNLTYLFVDANSLDLRGIEKLSNLKKLRLWNRVTLTNSTDALTKLPELEELILDFENESLDCLGEVSRLKRLELQVAKTVDFRVLRGFVSLTSFCMGYFEYRTRFTNLLELENCCDLEYLDLTHCDVEELTPLTSFTKLTTLILIDPLARDFSPLAKLKSVVKLNISNSHFRDLRLLQNLPNLKVLECADTKVCNISALPTFPVLEEIDLTSCSISCYAPLYRCPRPLLVSADIFKKKSTRTK